MRIGMSAGTASEKRALRLPVLFAAASPASLRMRLSCSLSPHDSVHSISHRAASCILSHNALRFSSYSSVLTSLSWPVLHTLPHVLGQVRRHVQRGGQRALAVPLGTTASTACRRGMSRIGAATVLTVPSPPHATNKRAAVRERAGGDVVRIGLCAGVSHEETVELNDERRVHEAQIVRGVTRSAHGVDDHARWRGDERCAVEGDVASVASHDVYRGEGAGE
ncbi:hypothetical protein FGB62_12g01 [Gracilaria domingensis]|nr:hypothetical protein FGB62_12g01 [Gracilaria domingensis]